MALRRRRVGGEAALLVLVDDCAAVRGIVAALPLPWRGGGIVALVKHSRAAGRQRGSVAVAVAYA